MNTAISESARDSLGMGEALGRRRLEKTARSGFRSRTASWHRRIEQTFR